MATDPAATRRSETRSITIDAPPDTVFDYVANPLNLPEWAPGLAKSIRWDGTNWVMTTIAGEAVITVRTSAEARTVDLLAGKQPAVGERGSYSRVLANGAGSEFVFTLFFPASFSDEAVERQMAAVDGELAAVKRLVEG
jgi:hypothetical protein